MIFHIANNSYITETTPIKWRALRFMTFEIVQFVGEERNNQERKRERENK